MKVLGSLLLCAASASALASCTNNSTGGNNPPDLTGTWVATKAEVVNQSNATQKVDFIAFGATATVVFTGGSGFSLTLSIPGQAASTETGTYAETSTSLTATITGGSAAGEIWSFTMSLSGNTLTLTGASTTFDFDDGNGQVPVHINLTLQKQ